MRTVVCTLLALYGLLLAPPPAEAQRRGGVVVTYTYRTHYYYKPGGRSSGGSEMKRDLSVLAPPPPTPQTYHWLGAGGSAADLWILFRGTDQIGQYVMADDVYRRINTDGTFSDPAPRPWRTNPGLIPLPPPMAEKRAKAQEVARVEAARTQEEQLQAQAAAPKSPVEKFLQEMPPWTVYTAGGGAAGLALLFGFAAFGRRK